MVTATATTIAALAIAALCTFTARADAKGCHEHSEVVGYRDCSRFGDWWSRDADGLRIRAELEWLHHDFIARPPALLDTAPFATSSDGLTMRVILSTDWLYGGLEGGPSGIHVPSAIALIENVEIRGGAVVGTHVSLWRFTLSAEAFAGGQYRSFGRCGETSCDIEGSGVRALEARVRAELHVHPLVSIGVGYGRSLVDSTDRSLMLSLVVHGKPYDGLP